MFEIYHYFSDMAKHYETGKQGEQMAVDFLQKHQYQILERNWRHLNAEVDVIARKGDTVVCVEVKTRTSDYFGNPQEFVSAKKVKLLVAAMNHYVITKGLDVEVRFDIIAVKHTQQSTEIEHLEAAFLHF